MKRIVVAVLIALVSLGVVFAGGQKEDGSSGETTETKETRSMKVSVGSKNFTEQYIISQMMAQLLENAGFNVSKDFGMSTNVVRQALETNQIDLYAEYTGTAWVTFLKQEEPIRDPDKLFTEVKKADKENGIEWLYKMNLNNTYALAVKKEFAEEHGLSTLSDLADLINKDPEKYTLAIGFEFYDRPDGFFAMVDHYGINIDKGTNKVKTMELGLSYDAIDSGDVQVAMVFATDGKLKKYDMTVLEDDKQFFPVYSLCPTVHEDALAEYPEIKKILMPLKELVDGETMIGLNYKVDAEGEEPEAVAEAFLKENNLID